MNVKMSRKLYSNKDVGKMTQALVDLGFTDILYRRIDGSTGGAKDILVMEALSCDWKIEGQDDLQYIIDVIQERAKNSESTHQQDMYVWMVSEIEDILQSRKG